MKKFTLALSALLMAASASALESGLTYAVIPADASAQAAGMFLSVNAEGKLAYTNELTPETKWEYSVGEFDENFNMPYYLTNSGKYLKISETGATVETEPAMTFVNSSQYVDYGSTICNGTYMWYPSMETPWYYLNALNLSTEPEQSVATAFFFVEVTDETTSADILNELWKMAHPEAMVLAVGGAGARNKGKYMAVTDEGRLITTNTLSDNAVWERGWDDETGNETFSNLGVKGYLYQGNQSRNITLSPTPVPVAVVESEVLIGAFGFTTNLDATPADYTFLNALNTSTADENGGIGIWNLDEGSSFFALPYDPSVTAEAIDQQVTELYDLGKIKAAGLPVLKKYMNASWAGRTYGDDALYDVENAETSEEYEEAYRAAMQAAVSFAEMSMVEGFVLKNTRMNQPINYVNDPAKPFQRQAAMNLNSLWTAQTVEETETVDGYEFHSFTLRNNASGLFMGKVSGNSKAMPSADDAETAATMRLVIGNNGFEIIQTNSGVDNAYVNVSTNEAYPELTIWTYANDGGAFFTFDQLPVFDPEEVVTVEGVGEIVESDWAKEYKSLTAVRVCVPVGSTTTGNGEIVMTKTDYDEFYNEETVTISKWPVAALADITPEIIKIGVISMDPDTWDWVTDSVDVQAYTLILRDEITEAGHYTVTVGQYAFALTKDGTETFSPAFENHLYIAAEPTLATIVVTPEAGTVEEIPVITIDPEGVQEWGINWSSASGANITVTFNGEIAKDTDGNLLDLDGDALAPYDAFDMETWTGGGWEIPVNFTEPGEYVLTIPEAFFENNDGEINEETVVEWTIDDKDGIREITAIKVNGKAYDLTGRPVANPGRGIYIINGVKTLVK